MITGSPSSLRRRAGAALSAVIVLWGAGCSSGSDVELESGVDVGSGESSAGDVFSDGGSATEGESPVEEGDVVEGVVESDDDVESEDDPSGNDFTETETEDDGEIEQVPADRVETVGSPPPTFVYTEEVAPAESLAATLCNLNATFVQTLRAVDDTGDPIVDDGLRLGVLSLSDSASLWEDLQVSFPETADDLETVRRIEELWLSAIAADDEGDLDASAELMAEADVEISRLPEAGPDDLESCES